ncbi:MAG: AmmeMemoRadiSam system protein B [Gammaproteobacteria bacterium]|nr:AmmeMemoRadiSam system protein B [Gammaproteobacteria bacterium]MBU6508595.1 AmmeMemoRadiSam system protein B [Gammaproteobacteria bacterium]MDE1983082.1 AmmeMemoRadiSam system protein B [Gammaproteobacteria bacterium]MDE2107571.1 AmmeMemoRadiSam system protein B [Gammaproteobacteria bacterium]MDE2459862.1 AmmeMemoRadiSam system protein B [Gammaproteobacteria bacterium]
MTTRAVRVPAVAGLFYPGEAPALRAQLVQLLADNPAAGAAPKALIAPHAGYVYSGPIAARAYNRAALHADTVQRVVLLGPAHRVALRGLALPGVDAFGTPLGNVPLDRDALASIEDLPQVTRSDAAHALEHSLEVHLPFLQILLARFTLVPLVVGSATTDEVAEVVSKLWGGDETLVVISSDLSHYHAYDSARDLDEDTAQRIEACAVPIPDAQACGAYPINGLLSVARQRQLRVERLDLRNSGDTAGDKRRVVGYGAWAFV